MTPNAMRPVKVRRKTTLPFVQRINQASLGTLQRRGISIKQLLNPKKAKFKTFAQRMLQSYIDHNTSLKGAAPSKAKGQPRAA